MLQCRIQSVLDLLEMDVTTLHPQRFGSYLKSMLQRNTWERRRSWLPQLWKAILSRLWNYCASHAKWGRVTFAPTLGSRSPPIGASATAHEVGANATPAPVNTITLVSVSSWLTSALLLLLLHLFASRHFCHVSDLLAVRWAAPRCRVVVWSPGPASLG